MFENSNLEVVEHCLACGSGDLELTLNLGNQPLANSYKLHRDEEQEEFPLAINHCKKCFHVQLTHAVNPDLMFKDYLYVTGTSKTMNEHCKWFADYATEYFFATANRRPADVLDIGCNDGTQLNFFQEKNVATFGVDPAENLHEISSKKHAVTCGYFDERFVKNNPMMYDILVAQNVFAHNYDPLSFLNAASKIMSAQSLFFVQTSQADMILNSEFDTIYHEHISFYNINSMNELCKRAGLYLVDVAKCPLHGNSYIFVIGKVQTRPANVANLIEMERKAGLLDEETYIMYSAWSQRLIENLAELLSDARVNGYKLIGYGAAAKGMTLLNWGKIELDYIVDDNPLKQGRYTPGMSTPIVSSKLLTELKSDEKVVFIPLAWNFYEEIRNKIKTIRNNDNDVFVTYFPEIGAHT